MPSYMSKLRGPVKFLGWEGGLKSSLELLLGNQKLLCGNSNLFHSVPYSSLTELHALLRPDAISGASSELVNHRRSISVLGAISRTFSIPSVSSPALQTCGYHIDCAIAESYQYSTHSKCQDKPMAACGSRATLGECSLDNLSFRNAAYLSPSAISAGICFNSRSVDSCRKASMSLKNQEQPSNSVIYGYFTYNVAKRFCSSYLQTVSGVRDLHSSSTSQFAAGSAPNVSFDNSAREEQLANSTDSSEQKISMGKSLKLVSGSCYLPHPDKEDTGGEDAHFICVDEQAIGVADGVGGWADLGVDAGQYSRELMSNSVNAVQEEPKGSIDPARVLEKAHSKTKAKGSSTACIIALTEQGLHAINLGDSGFMVVRDGCTIFRSPVQQHDFNFTFQLESGNNGDLPSSGQVFSVPVAPGDVIIAGTDGLFDNLYNNEITAVVVHAMRAGLGAQVTAQKIAALARQRAQDKDRQTPFSTAAQDAGFRYYGGKLDDITVVVSYVTSSNDK
ncbi:probable protein phosphatase 2C 55 isoform X1 [Benincasa hispida]|uniref:probable protein phosphatase 2C 55 isoform X1 n=1 Tax=Benincasa hispida TaxID=102211 RepID=UPI0019007A76|nr:probable protein phosphatase 2C 55 isoform X1 [Benincasa hispida]